MLHAWREWTDSTPDELTSAAQLLQLPPLPDIPEIVRGKSFAAIEAAFLGDEADGAALMAPLRELGPEMDMFGMVPPAALGELRMDPPDPVPYKSESRMLGDLSPDAIDELLAVAGPGSGSPLLMVELRQAGGALARSAEGHGALASLSGSFVAFAVGIAMDEAGTAAGERQLALVGDALTPHSESVYLNFAEVETDASEAYSRETYSRLKAVKEQYDPNGLLRANHPIR